MSELRLSPPFDGRDGEGRPEVHRPALDPQIRDRVLDYLAYAPVVLSARSYDVDDFNVEDRDVPMNFHTDGVFVWPGAVPHYLRKYGVPPEADLVAHIVAKKFEVGVVSEEDRQAAVRKVVG